MKTVSIGDEAIQRVMVGRKITTNEAVILALDEDGTFILGVDKEKVTAMSTTTPLGAGATFDSGFQDLKPYTKLTGLLYCGHSVNQNANGDLYIDQSEDGTNIDYTYHIAVTDAYLAGNGISIMEDIYAKYVKVRYVNGANAQDTMRLAIYRRML